jgi:hypothetical protein
MKAAGVLFVGLVPFAAACSSSYEQKDVVAAQPGLVTPDANGTPISESAACSAVLDGLTAARARLSCASDGGPLACPAYIRPPGGTRCLQYDKGTVDGCVAIIASYKSCAELESKPCIVTALAQTEPGCDVAGDAGTDAESDASVGDSSTDAHSDSSTDSAPSDASKDAPLG